ncbi:unnamed protein product [Paramecium sonneborni]|uniref:Uncharacterized protein n=1 Tax=Paramecium sonneborni TaxID=65129 RepID=A0A8S1R7Y5_9CILI|nr:unnamed protein product [Paramecium sonneborni]
MSTMLLIETIRRQEKKIDDLRFKIQRSESVKKSNRNIDSVQKKEYIKSKTFNKINTSPAQKMKEKDLTINILTERLNRAFVIESELKYQFKKQKVMFKCLYNELYSEVQNMKSEIKRLTTPQKYKKVLYF